jgi:hypothetical protein
MSFPQTFSGIFSGNFLSEMQDIVLLCYSLRVFGGVVHILRLDGTAPPRLWVARSVASWTYPFDRRA